MRHSFLTSAITAALAIGPAHAGGIPIFDAGKFVERTKGILQKELDFAEQLKKLEEARQIIAKGREALGEMTAVTDEVKRTAAVVESVRSTAAFVVPPVTPYTSPAEMSPAADILFGRPRASLERRIVRTALAFKDSAGVRKVGLSPFEWRALFQSLIKQESAFNPTAQSHVGAYGLTQLMPGTAGDMGVNRHDIDDNLKGGAKYITIQLNTFGRIDHALAAYNAGPGNVRKHGGIPPFKETRGYVKRITGFWRDYIARFGSGAPPDIEGTGEAGDFASGQNAATAQAVTAYTEELATEADAARARIQEIVNKIDLAVSEKTSRDLNTALKAELAKLMSILGRIRAAVAEFRSSNAILIASDRDAARQFMDWRYTR